MNKRLVIFAGTYVQASEWAKGHGIGRADFIYPMTRHDLYGLRGLEFVRVGTWYERHDASEIETELVLSGVTERAEECKNQGESR